MGSGMMLSILVVVAVTLFVVVYLITHAYEASQVSTYRRTLPPSEHAYFDSFVLGGGDWRAHRRGARAMSRADARREAGER